MNLKNIPAPPFTVLALAGSAGSHVAIATILQQLPPAFSLPIIVMQHLPPDAADTDEFYRRLAPFAVEWVHKGSVLASGKVLLCPPRSFVDLLPDGAFVLAPNARGAVDKPIDRFLASIARSFGAYAIGVVLTGMGNDGAQVGIGGNPPRLWR